MIGVTRSTHPNCSANWAGNQVLISKPVSPALSIGTSTTSHGCSACWMAAIGWSGWGRGELSVISRRTNPPLPTRTQDAAKTLRRKMTDAEQKLWYRLRGGRLDGLKFRRQHPVPPYVVDFYCREAGLVVELDGSQHSLDVDATRTAVLKRQG